MRKEKNRERWRRQKERKGGIKEREDRKSNTAS